MHLPDTKIALIKPFAAEDATQGAETKAPKGAKGPEATGASVQSVLKEAREADVVTISKELRSILKAVFSSDTELKSVLSSVLSPEADPSGQPVIPWDADIDTLISTLIKEKVFKKDDCSPRAAAGIDDAFNYSEPEEEVTISKGLRSVLKSVLLSGAGSSRQIDIPHASGMSPFVSTLLNEVLPGWRVVLIKVYRRKRRNGSGKKKEGDEEGSQESPQDAGDEVFERGQAGRYETGQIKLKTSGLIRTSDRKGFRFNLEVNIKSGSAVELRANAIRLDDVVINYAGAQDGLEDSWFAFDIDNDVCVETSPFAGGFGRLIVDLVEAGVADDGSAIYAYPFQNAAGASPDGFTDNGWVEEIDLRSNNR